MRILCRSRPEGNHRSLVIVGFGEGRKVVLVSLVGGAVVPSDKKMKHRGGSAGGGRGTWGVLMEGGNLVSISGGRELGKRN